MKVVISPSAADDIEAATRWWEANRPKAPGLFERELLMALAIIGHSPRSFAVMPKSRSLVYFKALRKKSAFCGVWHLRGAAASP